MHMLSCVGGTQAMRMHAHACVWGGRRVLTATPFHMLALQGPQARATIIEI